MNIKKIIAILFIITTFSACSPIVATRGNFISEHNFKKISTNNSKRSDVIQNWGPPSATSSFDQNIWYYVGETTEQKGVFAPKVIARRVIKLEFSKEDNETVMAITDIDPAEAKEVNLVDRTTPTAGKEFTILQQLIGNMGKYNQNLGK